MHLSFKSYGKQDTNKSMKIIVYIFKPYILYSKPSSNIIFLIGSSLISNKSEFSELSQHSSIQSYCPFVTEVWNNSGGGREVYIVGYLSLRSFF